MASTLTKLLVHVTYSTKNREPLIPPALEPDLFAYIGGICRGTKSVLLAMNGTPDHVHMLVSLAKTASLSNRMLNVKRDSSIWIKERGAALRGFGWQDGYFAFSLGQSGVVPLRAYIAGQKEHHAGLDYKDEVRGFLRQEEIEWDERYVWE